MAISGSSRVKVLIHLLLVLLTGLSPFATAEISYAAHCASTVAPSTPLSSASYSAFQLYNGYFIGGDDILGPDPSPSISRLRSFYFEPRSLRRTQSPAVLHLAGTLVLRGGGGFRLPRRNLTEHRSLLRKRFYPHLPRLRLPIGRASFDLSGFYSEATGLLCMVGGGSSSSGLFTGGNSRELQAVFKLNYPNTSTITTSLASGIVEVFDNSQSLNPISVMVYAQNNYNYTQILKAEDSCSRVEDHVVKLKLNFTNSSFCSYMKLFVTMPIRLNYDLNCSVGHCSPLKDGYIPSFMSVNQIHCSDDGKFRSDIGLYDANSFKYASPLVPGRGLVGEGVWDERRRQLCFVACVVPNVSNPLLGMGIDDCTISFSLWFPMVHTIVSRSIMTGRIWSHRDKNDSAYFDAIAFGSTMGGMGHLTGLRYEYTKLDVVRKSCVMEGARKVWNAKYPNGKSFLDMKFQISVRDTKEKFAWGEAVPYSAGDKFYGDQYAGDQTDVPEQGSMEMNHNLWNISYKIHYKFINAFSLNRSEVADISAEGFYNSETGLLCMVGCRYRELVTEQVKSGDVLDCAMLINIQLSPLNSKDGVHLTGKITSTREKFDPLFFEPLEISSSGLYATEASESISRMDIEITMVLISLTLSCVFIGLQLFHVKKNPYVLPSISITMLVLLTLCHMIPLLLNFEALFFMKRNRQDILLRSGGWLEVNEVVVRIITMVAFLLQARLLQVACSARSAEESKTVFWNAERKSLLLCLPLYIFVGLIAWFVHSGSNETQHRRSVWFVHSGSNETQHRRSVWFVHSGSNETQHRRSVSIASHRHSLWDDIISFAGFIVDGFLLPQAILNMFLDTKDKALVPSFYVGTTIVRALPHVYDAYRAHYYVPHFKSSYIYASPYGDLYSSVWDTIIPCEGVIFAVVIFLQQKFGGTCHLSRKSNGAGQYEMVPVVTQ